MWLGELKRSWRFLPLLCYLSCVYSRPCFSSSDKFFVLFSLRTPVSLFFLFLWPCMIHARMPERGRAFVHGHTFLHSWSGPMTLVVNLLHGATFLCNLTHVLFVPFIGPYLVVGKDTLLNPTYNKNNCQLISRIYSYHLTRQTVNSIRKFW